MMLPRRRASRPAGFTIIETLIATAVFSVILLVLTAAILQFSKEYYKGVIASSTQSAARTLVDDVTRSIQFNSGTISQLSANGSTGYCVGTAKRYSYALNQQVTDSGAIPAQHQGKHGLVSDSVVSCNTGTPALAVKSLGNLTTSDARELLGQHMRLVKFKLTPDSTGQIYTINVRIAYGDDDLLCSPSIHGDCDNPSSRAGVNASAGDLMCRSTAGSQYCAVSELTTTVKKRVL